MNFSDALNVLLHTPSAMRRAGWNGKGMFVYAVAEGRYPAVSQVAQTHWGHENVVPYSPYLAIKGADGIVSPWTPSQPDMFATDWEFAEI